MTEGSDLAGEIRLPAELDAHLRDSNPWWERKPARVVPPYRRWAYTHLLRRLEEGLAPAVVLRGARQVGKTTILEQVIDHLLREKRISPNRILRVQFDEIPSLRGLRDPILAIVRWFANRILGSTLNEAAHAGSPAFLFFDEVQNLPDWTVQIKALVDHHTVRAVVTGSSALRIEAGRDSLAGRVTTLELGTALLREIAGLRFGTEVEPALTPNGLDRLLDPAFWRGLNERTRRDRELVEESFRAYSERGGYPIAHARAGVPWPDVADQLNENVVRRAIRHDLRIGDRGRRRDPDLLEEVFRLACRYAGQAPRPAIFLHELTSARSERTWAGSGC